MSVRKRAAGNESVDLTVDLGPLQLKNPVMLASGTCGWGLELAEWFDIGKLGAVVLKGLTLQPRFGNAPLRIAEAKAGLLNAVGLQNPGLEVFLTELLPQIRTLGVPLIANISGKTPGEYAAVARGLDAADGIAAIEINVSCPNLSRGGRNFGQDCDATEEVVAAVRLATEKPLLTKLSPNVTDIGAIARSAVNGGSDVLSLINSVVGMAVDIEKRRPVLSHVTGGLTGPCIKPVALACLWKVREAVSVPLVGMGGIVEASDALEFLLCGARAVAVGSATFANPLAASEILEGIREFFAGRGIGCLRDWVGSLIIEEER